VARATFPLDIIHPIDEIIPYGAESLTPDVILHTARNLQTIRKDRLKSIIWHRYKNETTTIDELLQDNWPMGLESQTSADESLINTQQKEEAKARLLSNIPNTLMQHIVQYYTNVVTYDMQIAKYRFKDEPNDLARINSYLILTYLGDIITKPGDRELTKRSLYKIALLLLEDITPIHCCPIKS